MEQRSISAQERRRSELLPKFSHFNLERFFLTMYKLFV